MRFLLYTKPKKPKKKAHTWLLILRVKSAIMVGMCFGKGRRTIVSNIKNTKKVFVLITVGFSAQLCNE